MTDFAASDLKTIYPAPSPRVIAKARPEIDAHARKFIAMSPFCVLATSGSDGSVDASPRGGNPGFVHVTGPNELLMPDRSGNNRIDSFRNIVEGSGLLQLIFFVPGIDETLRVGGKGTLTTDPALMASMVEFGKQPRAEACRTPPSRPADRDPPTACPCHRHAAFRRYRARRRSAARSPSPRRCCESCRSGARPPGAKPPAIARPPTGLRMKNRFELPPSTISR